MPCLEQPEKTPEPRYCDGTTSGAKYLLGETSASRVEIASPSFAVSDLVLRFSPVSSQSC